MGRTDYRLDSLVNENRRLKQQLDAMAIENRKITARNAELEMKLNESVAAVKTETPAVPVITEPEPTPPPRATERPAPVVKTPSAPSKTKTQSSPDLFPKYSDALQVYRNRDYTSAIGQFEALIREGIGNDLVDNCNYWIGQSYYDLKEYSQAIPHFEKILRMKGADKKPDAQIMIANCYAEMGNTEAAKAAYEKVIKNYPTSPYTRKAQERLSRLK
jgi:tol-pal system protein YbgF